VQHELYEILHRWIEASPQRPANPEIVASAVSWAIFGVGLQWSRNEAGASAEKVADQALRVIVEGLSGSVAMRA
jgi:hypothetical protein